MIRIILFTIVYLTALSVLAQGKDVPIKFDNTTHDFGEIKEADGNVEFTFQFTNTGTNEFTIQDVIVSCGCTTPEWTKETITPGENGFIKAEFDPTDRPGEFNKSLTVFYNENMESIDLFIKGNVEPMLKSTEEEYPVVMGGIRVQSRVINFLKVTTEKPVSQTIPVYNEMSKSAEWDSDYETSDHISVKFIPEEIPAKSYGNIEVTYDPRNIELLGYKGDKLEVSTDEWFNSTKRFTVVAFIEEYFPSLDTNQLAQAPILKIDKPIHDFGSIKPGEIVTHDFTITNVGKEPLNIRMTRASCGCTASKPENSDLKPGESSSINVIFDSKGKSGEQEEIILVFSNDPVHPTQKLRIKSLIIGH